MAIIKNAANMKITVNSAYTVISSTLKKDAEAIRVDATKENLAINCIKKITATGEKK